MAKEIERKFLVADDSYKDMATGRRHIVQGYLSQAVDATVRVRISDTKAYLTVKGRNHGAVRDEWEYDIPMDDALDMLARCCGGRVIDKMRYLVPYEGFIWEIDEFAGAHASLVVAEVEMPSASADVPLPSFIGAEVTGDPRYYNSVLITAGLPQIQGE